MIRTAPLMLLASIGLASPANAAERFKFWDGNTLYELATVAPLVFTGYSAAIGDALAGGAIIYGFRACFASGTVVQQLGDVVRNFLVVHPELRQLPASDLAAMALAHAFPCR